MLVLEHFPSFRTLFLSSPLHSPPSDCCSQLFRIYRCLLDHLLQHPVHHLHSIPVRPSIAKDPTVGGGVLQHSGHGIWKQTLALGKSSVCTKVITRVLKGFGMWANLNPFARQLQSWAPRLPPPASSHHCNVLPAINSHPCMVLISIGILSSCTRSICAFAGNCSVLNGVVVTCIL